MNRAVVVTGTVATAVYAIVLASGRTILAPLALFAFFMFFRALFQRGILVAPFGITVVVFAAQNLAAGVLGRSHAASSLHVAIAVSTVLPLAITIAAWASDPRRA